MAIVGVIDGILNRLVTIGEIVIAVTAVKAVQITATIEIVITITT